MKAILVRHGETEYNASGMLQGYAPITLSTRGRQQAMLVGQRLRTVRPAVFYSSDMQRAVVAQMQAWAMQHEGETVLGVSHGMAIDLFVRHILGLDVMQPPPYRIVNTSVNIFSYHDRQWEVVTLNDISHLEAL